MVAFWIMEIFNFAKGWDMINVFEHTNKGIEVWFV